MNKSIAIAVGGLLAGGAALGAYKTGLVGTPYAEVVSSTPITIKEPIYGEVLDADPITQSVPARREVCENRQVRVRQPERFGDKDGMVVGAVVGGLLGNQFGRGTGRALATAAGAVGGGYAGSQIDRRHVGGKVTTQVQRACRTVSDTRQSTVGYDVQYRIDGQVANMRMDNRPGARILVGERDRVVGYEVNWRYKEKTGTLRMDERPGNKLPIRDGAIVVTTSRVVVDKS